MPIEDLNLPPVLPTSVVSDSVLHSYGTYTKTSKLQCSGIKTNEMDKVCKALTGDCNCSQCYDSSGYYWG